MSSLLIEVDSPAKINLGLEILGKRTDGFHEVRTVMVGLALADHLSVWATPPGEHPAGSALPEVPVEQNLISRSLIELTRASAGNAPASWNLIKRIPSASGLGGASSNAAAALIAGNCLGEEQLSSDRMHDIAIGLGSDVPFFLGSLCASVGGRGELVSPIDTSVVEESTILIVPAVQIPEKTATLYGLVDRADFSDGSTVDAAAASLSTDQPVRRDYLRNAFARPLYDLIPTLSIVPKTLDALGFDRHGLSGAGPAHYVFPGEGNVEAAEFAIRSALPETWTIVSTTTRTRPIDPIVRDLP